MVYKSVEERRKYHREYYHKNKQLQDVELTRNELGRFENKDSKKLPEDEIVNLYNSGKSTYDLSKQFGVDKTIIGRILKKNNVSIRDAKLVLSTKIGDKNSRYNGYGKITGTKWNQMKRSAKSRNLEFSITIEYTWNLFINQNSKCALSGIELTFANTVEEQIRCIGTASLDRIDSKLGYIEGNIQWVHKDVNFMKQSFNNEEFIEMCTKIVNYNKEKYEN